MSEGKKYQEETQLRKEISPVSPEDFPRMLKVWEASVRATHHFLSEADVQFIKPLVPSAFAQVAKLACVRDGAGQVAGFLGVEGDKVEMLFIHPLWRGQGFGGHLLRYAVEVLGARVVDVNEQNEQAVGFYLRMGFKIEGRSELDRTGRPFPLLQMRLGNITGELMSEYQDGFSLTPSSVDTFRTFGFIVLRQFCDPSPLAAEIDRVMRDGLVSDVSSSGEISFQYVPMMTAGTPVSLSLLDRLEALAVSLLGGSVVPTRAKGVRYRGNTPWHADSAFPLASIGCLAYLEPTGAESGALRVLPGSHHPEFGEAIRALGVAGQAAQALPAHVIVTEPGDIILLDEHLFHASFGGGTRRQWRVDYVKAPVGAEAEDHTKSYFASIYPPDWDGGYDVDRYPSYGPDWRDSSRPAVARLEALGVYELAATQEDFTRSRRRVCQRVSINGSTRAHDLT